MKTPKTLKSLSKTRPLVHEQISATIFCCDVIAMTLAFILAQLTAPLLRDFLFTVNSVSSLETASMRMQDMLFLFMCPFVIHLFFSKGHYTKRLPWWNQVQHILMICLAAFILDGAIRFSMNTSPSRLFIGLSWVYAALFVIAARLIVFHICSGQGLWRIPTIIIGDRQTVIDTLFAFAGDPYAGYDVDIVYMRDEKTKNIDLSILPKQYANLKIRQEVNDFGPVVKNNLDHFFVISLETFRGAERDKVMSDLEMLRALYAVVPAISRTNSYEMEPQQFFGSDIMLLQAKRTYFPPVGLALKRALDIICSASALLLLSPVMLGIMLMLKLEGQSGNTFYGGYRLGYRGKTFPCWKFQSMEPNSDHLLEELFTKDSEAKKEWDTYKKLKKDPRVNTRTAAFIRKTSLDELPQLWNVLKGEMSLVGPRPVLESEREDYGESFFRYYRRVRPGITGLWQVSGRNETSFKRRIYWDSWYVRNWSFWGDIVILIKTLRVVLYRNGAY